jgi:hypothetical protein
METRYEILELARFLTELSVIDYYFVVHKPSDVALAALLNSIDAVTGGSEIVILGFYNELLRVSGGFDPAKPEVEECRNRLHVLYTQGGYSRPEIHVGHQTRNETESPICVSYGVGLPQAYEPADGHSIAHGHITGLAVPDDGYDTAVDEINPVDEKLMMTGSEMQQECLSHSITVQSLHHKKKESQAETASGI